MKKKIFAVSLIVICLSILAYGTVAYFTDEDVAHNVITTGGVDITVEEWQEIGGELVPYPDEPIEVMPGATVSKIVTVLNEEAEAYIRARYEIIVRDSEGNIMELDEETLNSVFTIVVNTENWLVKPEDDVWLYYDSAVPTDESTSPLFTEVIFSGINMTNEYQNCTIEINVYAQGVQTANNGSSALEAAGWPAE